MFTLAFAQAHFSMCLSWLSGLCPKLQVLPTPVVSVTSGTTFSLKQIADVIVASGDLDHESSDQPGRMARPSVLKRRSASRSMYNIELTDVANKAGSSAYANIGMKWVV